MSDNIFIVKMQALDGFIMVFSSSGHIYYVSESITSLLSYLPSELMNSTIYEITFQEDQSHLYNILANAANSREQNSIKKGKPHNHVTQKNIIC
jgi:circadian locomoter output cycle kaput protein